MELERIIEGLNKKADPAGGLNFEQMELTAEEQSFADTYHPEKSLIIYGTLAPGRPNHGVVEHIRGTWQKGMVRGKLEEEGWGADLGFNGFVFAQPGEQEEINAFILQSDELQENWTALDKFEGEGYRRIFAPYELENGEKGAGYIYAINK